MTPDDLKRLTPEEAKRLSRGISTDMSPEAVSRRLEIAGELFELAAWLGKAKYVGKVRDLRPGTLGPKDDSERN